jgi:hypothetical protein
MGLFSIFKEFNIILNCFPKKSKNNDTMSKLYEESRKYKVSILPVSANYQLENLYPITNHVSSWSTFIIGSDKTFILANVNSRTIHLDKSNNIVDTKGTGLPSELFEFFNLVWDKTLKGNQLQFYLVLNERIYFINTYNFKNENNKIIGSILFMREFASLPQEYSNNHNPLTTTND